MTTMLRLYHFRIQRLIHHYEYVNKWLHGVPEDTKCLKRKCAAGPGHQGKWYRINFPRLD